MSKNAYRKKKSKLTELNGELVGDLGGVSHAPPKPYARSGEAWTPEESGFIVEQVCQGRAAPEIALSVQRTVGSICYQLAKLQVLVSSSGKPYSPSEDTYYRVVGQEEVFHFQPKRQ